MHNTGAQVVHNGKTSYNVYNKRAYRHILFCVSTSISQEAGKLEVHASNVFMHQPEAFWAVPGRSLSS